MIKFLKTIKHNFSDLSQLTTNNWCLYIMWQKNIVEKFINKHQPQLMGAVKFQPKIQKMENCPQQEETS